MLTTADLAPKHLKKWIGKFPAKTNAALRLKVFICCTLTIPTERQNKSYILAKGSS